MRKQLVIFFLILLIVSGCASSEEPNFNISEALQENTVTPLPLANTSKTPLISSQPNQLPANLTPAGPSPIPPEDPDDLISTSQGAKVVAPAGVVDLGDLQEEPAASDEGELVELPAPGVPDPQARLADLAKEDLAKRLVIVPSEITITSIKMMEWPDGSLGCPPQGGRVSKRLRSGFQIALEANGKDYTYHTDMGEKLVLCEQGRPVEP